MDMGQALLLWTALLLLRLARLLLITATGSRHLLPIARHESKDVLSDYCGYEKFSARCSNDEIILIRRALYGRMQSGRCVTSDYAHAMGCYADVTSYISGLCSGKQNCSFLVATMDSVAQPCAKDFKSYLEATYRCVKVSFTDDCLYRNVTSLTQNIGYLALYPRSSPVVKSNEPSPSSQTRTCYWLINVNSGRKIVISWARIFPGQSSVAHGYGSSSDELKSSLSSSCSVSLKFCEPSEPDVTLWACQSHRNQQGTIFSSKGHRLEIHVTYNIQQLQTPLSTWNKDSWKAQVLQYTVYGCSDLETTEGATIWRHADSAAIVCNYTGETWYLTCLDGEWTGEVGNCTKFAPRVLISPTAIYSNLDLRNGAMLAVLIGVAIGMLIGSLMLFAIILIKKNYTARSTYSADEPLYGAHIRVLSHYHNNYSTLRGKERPCSLHATDLSHLPPYSSHPLRSDADDGGSLLPPDVQQHLICPGSAPPSAVPSQPPPPPPPTDETLACSQMNRTAVDHVRVIDGLELIAVNREVQLTCGGSAIDGGGGDDMGYVPAGVHAVTHPYAQHYPVYSFKMSSHDGEGGGLEQNFSKCRTLVCALNSETQQPVCFCRPPAAAAARPL